MDDRLIQAINEVMRESGNKVLSAGLLSSALAGKVVKEGLLRTAQTLDASTGVPISGLRGIARGKAALAALAGGAVSAGGGGMAGGVRVLQKNAIKVELAIFGISNAVVVGQIVVRYRQIVRAEREAAEEQMTHRDDEAHPTTD